MMSTDLQRLAMFRFNFWPKPFFPSAPGSGGMDVPPFMPNPLSSPALMVLASSQSSENHETQRLSGQPHPFPGQSMDKDIPPPPPFSSAGFTMYRPFTAPMYSPLSLMRPAMDQPLALMNHGVRPGAFRTLGGPSVGDGVEGSYHSAFSPTKKVKSEETVGSSSGSCDPQSSHSRNGSFREGSLDREERELKEERPSSISSAGCDTISEPLSDSCDGYERGTPDSEGRSLRKQRKRPTPDGQNPCCPICGLTLRAGELESHLIMEVEKLDKLSRAGRKSRDTTPQGRKTLPSPSGFRKGKDSPPPEHASRARYDNFLRIRCNRQSRLSSRSRSRKKRPGEEGIKETVCPICSERLTGLPEELNAHVEICLKQRSEGMAEEEAVDVEGEYEEYEWAGQTRVRVTTMLQGGFAASGFQTVNSKRISDDDGELNVDGDDSDEFGKPQFNENDIIQLGGEGQSSSGEGRQTHKSSLSHPAQPESSFSSSASGGGPINAEASVSGTSASVNVNLLRPAQSCDQGGSSQANELVTALRTKLQDMEDEKTDKQKCLICMECYKDPVTSIQCWHVHCQDCWMRTLGAKKLCPQCNMITSPNDLRRIYL